jgi:hypothetical protein
MSSARSSIQLLRDSELVPVEDDRVEHRGEVAHRVLRDLRAERRAVEHDAPVAQRAARGVDVGRNGQAVIGRQVDALAAEAVDAALLYPALQRRGCVLAQALLVRRPCQAVGVRAVQVRLGVRGAALVEDDHVAVVEQRTEHLRGEEPEGQRLDQAAARAAGQDEHRRCLGRRVRRTGLQPQKAELDAPAGRR